MACSVNYKAAIFISEIDDEQILSSIMRYGESILLLTNRNVVKTRLENIGLQVLYVDIEKELNSSLVDNLESEKFIVYETSYIESGLIIDMLKNCTRSPIFIIKNNKRFIPTIYYQKLGASFVIYTSDITKLSSLID